MGGKIIKGSEYAHDLPLKRGVEIKSDNDYYVNYDTHILIDLTDIYCNSIPTSEELDKMLGDKYRSVFSIGGAE